MLTARRARNSHRDLEGPERGACVPVGHGNELVDGGGLRFGIKFGEPPRHDLADVVVPERVQAPESGTAQQGRVDTEIRILGRGTDQHDEAGLDRRQECVLLCAVEPVDLVDEKDRPRPVLAEAGPRSGDGLADVGDPRAHRLQRHEFLRALRRDGESERGLSRSRRAPQDGGGDAVLLDQRSQRRTGRHQMSLADHLVERPRSQPRRERPGRLERGCGRSAEEVAAVRERMARSRSPYSGAPSPPQAGPGRRAWR